MTRQKRKEAQAKHLRRIGKKRTLIPKELIRAWLFMPRRTKIPTE